MAPLCSVQGYGKKPPMGYLYPGSGRTADTRVADGVPAAEGHQPGEGQPAAGPAEVVEDPDKEFPGAVSDLPHGSGAPRIINVGIGGPGAAAGPAVAQQAAPLSSLPFC